MKRLSWVPQVWAVTLIFVPLLFVVILSFLTKGLYGGFSWIPTLQNFQKAAEPASLAIFLRTLFMALGTALSCTIIGSFCATFIAQGSRGRRFFWLTIFVMPFLINSLIRLYSLQNFVGTEGPLQSLIRLFSVDFKALGWSHNTIIMAIGLVATYLPFAILPLVSAFEKWDSSLSEASWDLGAGLWDSFWLVKWPLLRPAFLASFMIVFIPCLGEYLAPEILEGSRNLYWGQYITEAFLKWRNWPLGAALGVILMAILAISLWLSSKVQRWTQKN